MTVQQEAVCLRSVVSGVQIYYNCSAKPDMFMATAPHAKSIIWWYEQFQKTSIVDVKKSLVYPTSAKAVEGVSPSCLISPKSKLHDVYNLVFLRQFKKCNTSIYVFTLTKSQHQTKPTKHVEYASDMLSNIEDQSGICNI